MTYLDPIHCQKNIRTNKLSRAHNLKTSGVYDVTMMKCHQDKYVTTNDVTTVTGSCLYQIILSDILVVFLVFLVNSVCCCCCCCCFCKFFDARYVRDISE